MAAINFRSKEHSWDKYEITLDNGETRIIIPHTEDLFMKAFLSNYILRPSCYYCQFKGDSFQSDITLGDFWNINNSLPSYNDHKGVSEVIVRTDKGKQIFDALSNLDRIEVREKDAYQYSLYYSVKVPKNRDDYFSLINSKSIKEVNDIVITKKQASLLNRFFRKLSKLIHLNSKKNKTIKDEKLKLKRYFLKEKNDGSFDLKKSCVGCAACYNICPHKAITMKEDIEGFKYPSIDYSLCVNCGLCQKVCPVSKINNYNDSKPLFYAAKNTNEIERLSSSSGGIFALLAKYILKANGIISGAIVDENLKVKHITIDNEKDLKPILGSKYVQSDIECVYNEIKDYLKEGRLVLFSGTPCQVAGLKSFLNADFNNLITVDIICHGVPSPLVFRKYLDYLEMNSNTCAWGGVIFRSKFYSWENFAMELKQTKKSRLSVLN